MVSAIEATRTEPKGSEPAPPSKTANSALDTAATGLFALLMAHLQNIAEAAVQGDATGEVTATTDATGDVTEPTQEGEQAPTDPLLALLVASQAETLATAGQAQPAPVVAEDDPTTGISTVALLDVGEAKSDVPAPSIPASSAKYVVTPPLATPETIDDAKLTQTSDKEVTVSDADLAEVAEPLAATAKPVLESKNIGKNTDVAEKAPVAKVTPPQVDVAQAQADANAKTDEAQPGFRETKPLNMAELLKQAAGSGGRAETVEKPAGVKGDDTAPAPTQRIDMSANVHTSVDTKGAKGVEASTQKVETPLQAERPTLQTLHEFTVRGVKYLVREGGDTVTVRLVPESLGEVRFDVTRNQDTVSVRLVSANPAVRTVLESQVHGLRDQLTQDGFSVSQIVVTADAASSNSQGGQWGNAWSDQTPAWRNSDAASSFNTARNQTYETPARRGAQHNGALDVFA